MPLCAGLRRSLFSPQRACQLAARAFRHRNAATEIQAERSCPVSSASDYDQSSGPTISIAEVTFSGPLEMPITDQAQIADSIKQQNYRNSSDGLIDDAVDRVKAGWLDHGYFKVQVSGEKGH